MSQWRPRGPQSKNWKRTWVSGQYPSLTDRRRTSPARRGWVQKFGPAEPPGRISKDPSPAAVRSRWGSAWQPCEERAPGTSRRRSEDRPTHRGGPKPLGIACQRKTSAVTESIPLLCRAPLCCNTRPEGLAPQVRSAESGPAPKHHTGRAFTCGQRVPGRGEYRCSSSH